MDNKLIKKLQPITSRFARFVVFAPGGHIVVEGMNAKAQTDLGSKVINTWAMLGPALQVIESMTKEEVEEFIRLTE